MRVAILSDIHANSEALEAVLAHMEPRRVDAVWFLGDAVGYGADAELVIDWLGSAGLAGVVRGNHDKVVAGIEEPDTFSPIARDAALRTRELISPEAAAALRLLPRGPVLVTDAVGLCHGSWFDEDYYIFAPSDAHATFEHMDCSALFFGHTHRACIYAQWDGSTVELPYEGGAEVTLREDARYLINPGSVGQPRDRDPRAAYALFDPDERRLALFRVPYDVREAQIKIVKAGLPEMNAARLSEGR
ncbi:metallophosphatase family protein [Candidatus Poribacteria bacterium]|nr:metallophosphatase family protein [Candidatus Poribacteria bacterium]